MVCERRTKSDKSTGPERNPYTERDSGVRSALEVSGRVRKTAQNLGVFSPQGQGETGFEKGWWRPTCDETGHWEVIVLR